MNENDKTTVKKTTEIYTAYLTELIKGTDLQEAVVKGETSTGSLVETAKTAMNVAAQLTAAHIIKSSLTAINEKLEQIYMEMRP